ncbi:MAG TPA: VIT1/CCC1 transporter family protein [Candidatus Andersenbacteria bacterium]|nr:VIT1/CCC1 transporter family protein [Candidatus Andersenbacteria bacterium]
MLGIFRRMRRRSIQSFSIEEVARAHENGTETALMHGASHGEFVGDFVFGGIDGVITTFAIVSGVAGAHLSAGIVLIAGIASLLADGFAMGVGNFLSIQSEQEHFNQERAHEAWEVEHIPEHEKKEIEDIYRAQGFSGETLSRIVENITADKDRWIDTMMREELHLAPQSRSALSAGFVTFVSFIVIGIVPLCSYVLALFFPQLLASTFILSVIFTGIALFVIGALKSLVTGQSMFRSGMEILLVGSFVAFVAYVVGFFLKDLPL